LNMNSDALLGYTWSIPNGPDVTLMGIPAVMGPAVMGPGVMGMDTIAGVLTGELVAPPGSRSTGMVSRGRVRWGRPGGGPSGLGVVSVGDDIGYAEDVT
jgi:hypothetical protein